MSIGPIFDVAASGMSAQSVRMNTIASNLANAQSAAGSADAAYRARHPLFSAVQRDVLAQAMGGGLFAEDSAMAKANAGVSVLGIVESEAPAQRRFEPNHPLADGEGYVFYPNVNVVEEMADMMSASRAFKLNVDAMEAAKSMMQRILTLGQ